MSPLRRRWPTALCALVVLALAGCGATAQRGSTGPSGGGADVQFRVVAQSDVAPTPTPATAPPADAVAAYDAFSCPGVSAGLAPEEYLAACDAADVRYLLEPAAIMGGVESAEASITDGELQISGTFTEEEAESLADRIVAGGQ